MTGYYRWYKDTWNWIVVGIAVLWWTVILVILSLKG